MIYVYARCSINEKMQDINRQVRELKQQGAIDTTIHLEYESGMKADRAELICDIIELAKNKHIKLVLGNFVVDCSKELDPITEGMLKMMGVFSELERNIINQRVKSGMENEKAKGKTIGRPVTTTEDIPNILYKLYSKYKKGAINKKEFSRLCNLSYPTIYKYLGIVER